MDKRPPLPSSRTLTQVCPNAKSVRGSPLMASAGGFRSRIDTRVLFPLKGLLTARMVLAGVERDADTGLRMLDQGFWGGVFGDDERELPWPRFRLRSRRMGCLPPPPASPTAANISSS